MGLVRRAVALCTASLTALAPALAAAAETAGECQVVDVAFQPQLRADLSPGMNPAPQIVVWVEDTAGNYIDTLFITRETGTYGLGNRPGRWDFNSGPQWPYGRRTGVFPVWARRHGLVFDEVIFQNGDENNLSHPFNQSSRDTHYCRPMLAEEAAWDALSCASPTSVFTDKGALTGPVGKKSYYPPRQDITRTPGMDSPSVELYGSINPFDAVSQATPVPGQVAELSWPIPKDLVAGNYVMWVEVSKEFDHNETYSEAAYPSPTNIPWGDYGEAYRGQPSVVYEVPFTIGTAETVSQVTDYAGYSDPDALDGNLRAPDGTISTTTPGSGAARFALVSDAGGMYRVRVTSRPEFDSALPATPAQLAVEPASRSALVTFIAPGDDGMSGMVRGYDVRYRVNSTITADNFDDPTSLAPEIDLAVAAPGTEQSFELGGLLPETTYSVAIRAYDDCHNVSALQVIDFTTPERTLGEVDACFIATAAYGSVLAADVEMLRHLRDAVLKKSVLGELAVQTYYTFGPAVAGVIGESELLRSSAREVLAPLVRFVRAFRL